MQPIYNVYTTYADTRSDDVLYKTEPKHFATLLSNAVNVFAAVYYALSTRQPGMLQKAVSDNPATAVDSPLGHESCA